MASVTKTFTMQNAYNNGNVGLGLNPNRWPDSHTGLYYYWTETPHTDGYSARSTDVSDIPSNATIEKVHYSWSYSSSNMAVATSTRAISSNGATISDANLLSWFRSRGSATTLTFIFRTPASLGAAYASTNNSLERVYFSEAFTNIKIQVTYTVPDDDSVSFGTSNAWQKCKAYVAINGTWQKVKAYFGTGGSWKQVK